LVADKVRKRRLEWLGHVARMPDHRLPKSVLFGWLPQARPRCGPRKRWRDVMRKDLRDIGVDESVWYQEATQSRAAWRTRYRDGLDVYRENRTVVGLVAEREVVCDVCSRKFRRESDRKKHKCLAERRKPISEQRGAVQCQQCHSWFRSRGGLAVHRCRPGT